MSVQDHVKLTSAEPQLLKVEVVASGGTHTLIPAGDLDLASVVWLNEMIRHICARGTTSLVIDLRELTFIDSTGIHAIIDAARLCEEHGTEFRLIPGPKNVQRIFEVTRLTEVLPFRAEAQ